MPKLLITLPDDIVTPDYCGTPLGRVCPHLSSAFICHLFAKEVVLASAKEGRRPQRLRECVGAEIKTRVLYPTN